MTGHMKKIFEIIRKTGDRVILTDFNSEETYVLMSLTEYEGLLQTSEISQNSLVSGQTIESEPNTNTKNDIWEFMKGAGSSSETWDLSQMSAAELEVLERQYQTFTQTKAQEDENIKKTKEPRFSTEKDMGESGEEQFYLEPIE